VARFDLVVQFKTPMNRPSREAIKRFLGPDYALFARWIDILVFAFAGHSFSDIERDVQRFRRAVALGTTTDADLVEDFMKARALALDRQGRIDLAVMLAKQTRLSQHTVSDITGEPGHDPKVHQRDPAARKAAPRRKADA
jgi:hypothetical protein